MFIQFFIFLFILVLMCFVGSVLLQDIVARLTFAVLGTIIFMVLALACYDLEIVNVLAVNNTVVEHTTIVQSPTMSYVFLAFMLIEILNTIDLVFRLLRREVNE